MTDDRDRRWSSEEMLRAAHGEGRNGPDRGDPAVGESEIVEDDGDAVYPESDRAGVELTLRSSGLVVPMGNWWARAWANSHGSIIGLLRVKSYTLWADDREVAQIATSFSKDRTLGSAYSRTTRVHLVDGGRSVWRISAEPGSARPARTVFGKTTTRRSPNDRVVSVVDEGQAGLYSRRQARVLAQTRGSLKDLQDFEAEAGGTVYNLAMHRRAVVGSIRSTRSGSLNEVASVYRTGRLGSASWAVAATDRVPVALVLLCWHLLIDDHVYMGGSG